MNNAWRYKNGFSKLSLLFMVLAAFIVLYIVQAVPYWIYFSKAPKSLTEIKGAELALTKLMKGAHVESLLDLFIDPAALIKPTTQVTIEVQTAACYDLLQYGKNAKTGLKPEMRSRLGSTYMDLPKDFWMQPYRFYFGPLSGSVNTYIFRCYRGENYVYDLATYEAENKVTRGNPKPDPDTPPAKGYPCPGDLPVYIFSCGADRQPNQLPWGGNGGDDINNWDSYAGWSAFY
jgi:hypothetical protein